MAMSDESIIDRIFLELIRSMLSSSSRARSFYIRLIKQHAWGEMIGPKNSTRQCTSTFRK